MERGQLWLLLQGQVVTQERIQTNRGPGEMGPESQRRTGQERLSGLVPIMRRRRRSPCSPPDLLVWERSQDDGLVSSPDFPVGSLGTRLRPRDAEN